jgi:hypothetical protein
MLSQPRVPSRARCCGRAASGLARSDIESKFALLSPDIPSAIIHDGLAKAKVIFDVISKNMRSRLLL